MAIPPHNTYMSIPPPPLPEFYMSKEATADAGSSTRGTDDLGRKKYPPIPGDGTDERREYIRTRRTSDISSSLVVYHVCRICLRPRSARYHREHPIPIDGVPPPPGICRRCRVTSVDESKSLVDVVEHHESHGPKIGVKSLVVDEDYLPARAARSRRVNYDLDEVEWRELEPPPAEQSPPRKKEYIYRHILVAVPPPPIHPPPPTAPPQMAHLPTPDPPKAQPPEPTFIYVPKPDVKSTAQDAIDSISEKSAHSSRHTRYEIRHVKQSAPKEPSISEESVSRHIEHKKTTAPKARVELEVRSSYAVSDASKPEWTESQIQRLARDEVERYRRAERSMDAHGDAYAHGRMVPVERVPVVPVERRIEAQRDIKEEMPWKKEAVEKQSQPAYAMREREYRVRSKSKDREEEIHITRRSGARRQVDDFPSSKPARPPLPSDTSSDKTRWPAQETTKSIYEQDTTFLRCSGQPQWGAGDSSGAEVLQAKQKQVHNANVQHKQTKTSHWVDYEPPQPKTQIYEREVEVAESGLDYSRTSRRPEYPKNRHEERITMEYDRRDSGVDGLAQIQGKQKAQQRTQDVELPYPPDGLNPPVPMPSPSSHTSRPTKSAMRNDNEDSEYYYKLRTVQPADEATYLRSERDGIYYREDSEYLHRRKAAAADPTISEAPSANRKNIGARRPSDVSSRVRFANKVAISPTPPGSDASSVRDHRQGQVKEKGPEGVIDFAYGRRGGAPGRVAVEEYDYHTEQAARYPPQTKYRREEQGGPMRPEPRGRRPSGDTETATAPITLPVDMRMLARAQSESPSREKLIAAARRRREDGLGPYTIEHERSVSLEAYDGSSVGSDAAPPKHKHRREDRERAGQRGKR
ncbi:hypothetical protein M409DRAFT_17739 [Zasmidium cellare ATCC 36951]|uniref:Uncharacterized protein n=1 Tax=Zasmidium cellare ATCC 36951 TaxID=1080233 RepID=A0A6A6D4C4_ZASCE|nr:uncharacterized protein M409DRAFT_17739 [Zasmidium cellare ATCC 36951]KAF2172506.1 hypothetical protein M409DRAFT_17739 [Zasmidium cellare ATCC 36951]